MKKSLKFKKRNVLISNILIIMIVLLVGCTQNSEPQKVDLDAEKAAVNEVLNNYNSAIERLNIDNTFDLFYDDSQIFESGGSEGNYKHYVEHHLRPELKVFKSIKFSDYKIKTLVDLPYAFATESYNIAIVLAENDGEMNMEGVVTSVLKKKSGKWKILKHHSSARSLNAKFEGH